MHQEYYLFQLILRGSMKSKFYLETVLNAHRTHCSIDLLEFQRFFLSFNRMLTGNYLKIGHSWLLNSYKRSTTLTRRLICCSSPVDRSKTSIFRLQCIDHHSYSTQVHTTRQWKENNGSAIKHDTTFTVMSYNILAQNYVDSQPALYALHEPDSLKWPHRFNAIKREIDDIDPDILCLQEVQQTHLVDITAYFTSKGYETSMYKKRTGLQVDGCAIFYKRHLFDVIECHFVDYFQPGIRVSSIWYSIRFVSFREKLKKKMLIFRFQILNRCNVAVIGKLALKSQPHKPFIISTTHLLFNPRRKDVRLAQIQVLLAELDRIARDDHQFHQLSPIILTGDFNVQQSSNEYRLLIGKKVYPMQLLQQMNYNAGDCKHFLPPALGISDHCQHFNVVANKNRHQTAVRFCNSIDFHFKF